MKKFSVFYSLLIVAIFAIETYAFSFRIEGNPEFGTDSLVPGEPFTLDFYMNNNDGITRNYYSLPLVFYSPDESINEIIHRNIGGSGPTFSIEVENSFSQIWNIMNDWTGFSWGGNLPDTIHHMVISSVGSGWESGLGEILCYRFALQIDESGKFCVDSADMPDPSYDWMWEDPSPNFNGPYCWTVGCPENDWDCDWVVDESDNCPDRYNPDQTDSDEDGLGNLCDEYPYPLLYYEFEHCWGGQYSFYFPGCDEFWIMEGPGVINNSGVWNYYDPMNLAGEYTVVVQGCDYDESSNFCQTCSLVVSWTNDAPYFTISSDTVYAYWNRLIEHYFETRDCDALNLYMVDNGGAIGPMSLSFVLPPGGDGMISYTPDYSDQDINVQIGVSDGLLDDTCNNFFHMTEYPEDTIFTFGQYLSMGDNHPMSICAGDLNNDGDNDLATHNIWTDGSVSVILNEGIDVSTNGDMIIVAPGTYIENLDYLGKSIVVQSPPRAENTTIQYSTIQITSGESLAAHLSGCTDLGGSGSYVININNNSNLIVSFRYLKQKAWLSFIQRNHFTKFSRGNHENV